MHRGKWNVYLSGEARKAIKHNKKRTVPQYVKEVLKKLLLDIEHFGPKLGPQKTHWSHFSSLGQGKYHCHLLKSKNTPRSGKKEKGRSYVVCWSVEDKENYIVEVYYVGSHENAPY